MLEQKEYNGYFYLPETPDKKISGVLYFHPNERIRLELIGGCLSGKSISGLRCEYSDVEAIWGVVKTEHGASNVTLLACRAFGGRSSNSQQNCSICLTYFDCNYLLLGKHIANKEEQIFNKIRVTFPYFNDWYKENRIEFDCENNYTATYKTTKNYENSRKFKLNKNETINLFGFSGAYDIRRHEKCLYELSYIEYESVDKYMLHDLLVKVGWFQDFYSFAAMVAMPFSEIYLYDDVANIRYPLFFAEEEKFVENKGRIPLHHFLFDFPKIESHFETIMQGWYEKRENSEPIIQQLISSVTPRQFIKSSDFLTVIQAIEGYYNRFVKDDVALRDMLMCLYATYENVPIIVNNKPEVNQVVDSRHYYSHNLPEGKKDNVCKGFELFGLAEKLKPLLIGCALTLIGFGNNEIEELLQNYYNWNGNIYIKTK